MLGIIKSLKNWSCREIIAAENLHYNYNMQKSKPTSQIGQDEEFTEQAQRNVMPILLSNTRLHWLSDNIYVTLAKKVP